MINKILLIITLFAISAAGGDYVPKPAPNPMGIFNVYSDEVFHGKFYIEDASGPEGMRIVLDPNELTITLVTVEPISDYKDARKYTYYFDYTPTVSKTIIVKSYDSRSREVINSIVFNIIKDDLQVFTGCEEVVEPNIVTWKSQYFMWDLYEVKPQKEIPTVTGRTLYPHEYLGKKNIYVKLAGQVYRLDWN